MKKLEQVLGEDTVVVGWFKAELSQEGSLVDVNISNKSPIYAPGDMERVKKNVTSFLKKIDALVDKGIR